MFQPAFIFPRETPKAKNMAQYIKTTGELSDTKHPVEAIAKPEELEKAKKAKKSSSYLSAIKKFNDDNNTEF